VSLSWRGLLTGHDTLIRALCSLPCGVTVQTLFRSLADRIPDAMNTVLVSGQVTAKEAAEAIPGVLTTVDRKPPLSAHNLYFQ
jgi:hypothetical protein